MRIDKNDIMSSTQLLTLIASSIIGTGILSLARAVSEVAGRDGWISTFFGGVFVLIGILIISQLGKRFPNETFVEYTGKITGKFIAYIIILFYILYAIGISSLVTRFLAYLLNTWLLRYTPKVVINFIIVVLSVYLCRNGIKVLARFVEFTFFLLAPLVLLIFIPLGSAPTFMNIRPIGQEGLVNILKGMLPATYAYAGFEILLLFYPFVQERKKITRYSTYAIMIVVLLYTTSVAAQIIIFPQSSIAKMWMPVINYILNVRIPFITRIDLAFIYFWIIGIFSTIGIQYYTATIEIKQLFNIKDRKKVTLFIAPIVFILSSIPNNIIEINMIGDVLGRLSVVAGIIIPAVLLFLSVVLSKGGEHNG